MVSVEDFVYVKSLTKGAYGKIFLGRKIGHTELYAIKVLSKKEMKMKNMTQLVLNERNALAMSHSSFIVHLFYSLQTEKNVYLVMEYMPGGDLKSLILTCGCFSEAHTSMYTEEIMQGLFYLHNHGIVHRDLKPDNVLITSEGHIKLTDFGLSKVNVFDKNAQIQQILFTPSKNSKKRNLQYCRTPNQFKSLIDQLVFSKTKSIKHNQRSMSSSSLTQSDDTIKAEPDITIQDSDIKYVQVPGLSSPRKYQPLSSYESPISSKRNSLFVFKTPTKQIIKSKTSARQASLESKYRMRSNITTVSYLERAACFAEFQSPIRIDEYERLQAQNEPDIIENDIKKEPGAFVRGSPDYIAPELLLQASGLAEQNDAVADDNTEANDINNNELRNQKIKTEQDKFIEDSKADWWALGVIVFELLCGYMPFSDFSVEAIFENILNHNIPWPNISESKIPKDIEDDSISTWSKEVIDGLMDPNPKTRWTKKELADSAFITLYSLPKKKLPMPFVPVLNSDADTMYHETRNKILKLIINEPEEVTIDMDFSDHNYDDIYDEIEDSDTNTSNNNNATDNNNNYNKTSDRNDDDDDDDDDDW